jgi:hypothetical protein
MSDDIEQPPIKPGVQPGSKRYHAGSERSRAKLEQLKFDPIEKLVADYERVEKLIEVEMKLSTGEMKRLNSKGNEMTWYPDFLGKLLEQKSKIANDLLRYKYGRVSENTNVTVKQPMPFIVQTTKEGETYHAVGLDNNGENDD